MQQTNYMAFSIFPVTIINQVCGNVWNEIYKNFWFYEKATCFLDKNNEYQLRIGWFSSSCEEFDLDFL